MTTRVWSTIAWSSALLIACYGSNANTKDGQSHWLTACSSQDDCGADLICACGVCTMECESSTSCPGSATCRATEGESRCEDAPSALDQVCLPEPDGAGLDTDGGPLSCSETSELWSDTLSALLDEHTACIGELDCGCASTSTNCHAGCDVAVRGTRERDFSDAIKSFSSEYCGADDMPERCDFPSPECAECVAVCEQGRCVLTSRTRCSSDAQCDEGELCHIDETCMPLGVEDGNGTAVLATADLGAGDVNTGVAAFTLVDGGIVWLTSGTWNEDPTAEVEPAFVRRLDFASGEVTTLAGGIRRADHPSLKVAGELVFYTSASGISSVRIDGARGATLVVPRSETLSPSWAVDADFIYYTPEWRHPNLRRVRVDGTDDALLFEAPEDTVIHGVALDDTHVYVELSFRSEPFSSLMKMEKDGSAPATFVAQFRDSSTFGALLVSEAHIFSETDGQTRIQAHSLANGEGVAVVTAELTMPFIIVSSVSDGYLYYTELVDRADAAGRYMARVAWNGGAPERLRTGTGDPFNIVTADGYIYWSERGRLLRKRHE